MQNLAHAALNIVFQHHQGKLESFETDGMGRLLLADLVGRRIIRSRHTDEGAERQAIERWRTLVPEYVPAEMRKGPVAHRIKDIVRAFREAIYDRLRASVFDRLGQAQRLVAAYYARITAGFPMGLKPTTTRMHNVNYLQTPFGVLAIAPIRLALVRKLQRLAPELGKSTHQATIENCGWILADLVMNLNGRARDTENQYGDVIVKRNRERVEVDRRNGDDSSDEDTEDSDVTITRFDADDTVDVILARPLW